MLCCLSLQCLMVPWDDRVPKFTYTPGGEASSLFVPTVETTRLSYFLDSLLNNRCVDIRCQQSVSVIIKQSIIGKWVVTEQ